MNTSAGTATRFIEVTSTTSSAFENFKDELETGLGDAFVLSKVKAPGTYPARCLVPTPGTLFEGYKLCT